jgi:aspartate aminotransferase-like enzyme
MSANVLFTVGPVQMYPDSLEVGAQPLPYFRTAEFSKVVLGCEKGLLELARAPAGSRCAFLTMSGTGAMEACVLNAFGPDDRLLVVNGGSFGHRFVEICEALGIPHDEVVLAPGTALGEADLARFDLKRYTGLLINAHETSTGVLYDLPLVSRLCRQAGLVLVVDAISAFLCDPIAMADWGIDFLITSSQKALALGPGLSLVMVSPRGQERLAGRKVRSVYMNLATHLNDGARGQTPFTPAVGVILQLEARLAVLQREGDIDHHCRVAGAKAAYFRDLLGGLPLKLFSSRPSNALTSLTPTGSKAAYAVFLELKDRFGLVVTPNGGPLSETVFRVGHMGNLQNEHYERLVKAMKEVLS